MSSSEWRRSIEQQQFLDVVSRDEAMRRFRQALRLRPLGTEQVPLGDALHRILANDIVSGIDVPAFDRSNVDGFAVQSADTSGAMEEAPQYLGLNSEVLAPGVCPQQPVVVGTATPIATGGMIPRGADAVVMIEHTDVESALEASRKEKPDNQERCSTDRLRVLRAASPGQFISFAGSDIARGETVLRAGTKLTAREIGVLAALGLSGVTVWRRPRVAVISTGNEIVPPGQSLPLGAVYDSNAAIVSATIRELGSEPILLGTVRDDVEQLRRMLQTALTYDAVVMSGGTSKGAGDLSYQVVSELTEPGIVAHGVALKPGKPICLAVTDGKPVVVLPGFPTSAIFTFHEFVAPVLRELAGQPEATTASVRATLPMRVHSDKGRTEYLLVSLVPNDLPTNHDSTELTAWPMGKGSGSVTTFSMADGFITIDQHTEMLEAGSRVNVKLIGPDLVPADLVVIGSHCVGVDYLLGELRQRGFTAKVLNVGSLGGAAAVNRGECDLAGVHVIDGASGQYNLHLLTDSVALERGYRRLQGVVFRPDDARFKGRSLDEVVASVVARNTGSETDTLTMINRNPGSGTRILIDRLLQGIQPLGYNVQTKSHNAVATAVAQQRADWGVAIESVARSYGLGFLPVQDECYDFLIPRARRNRRAVVAFLELLHDETIQQRLREMHCVVPS